MRLELGRRPVRATIRPNHGEGTLGHVDHRRTRLDVEWFDDNDWRLRRWAETDIMTAFAGPEAERRFRGRRNNIGARSDHRWAMDVAIQSEGLGERPGAYLKWLHLKVSDYIANVNIWKSIESVASALLEKETLTGREVREAWREPHRLPSDLEASLQSLARRPRPIPATYKYRGWTIRREGRHYAVENPEGLLAVVEEESGEQTLFATLEDAQNVVDRALCNQPLPPPKHG